MAAPPRVPPRGALLAGKYRVERLIGAGGMGVVLASTHVKLHEPVAIKLLHEDVARRPGAVERFIREARVAMRLRGEHIVRIHDVGTLDDGAPYIVMEYLEGVDLGTRLAERGPFTVSEAVDSVLQACEALAEAHAMGVVHRDLKPANLFMATGVDGSPSIKVLDFGVSKVLGALPGMSDTLDSTAPSSERTPVSTGAPRESPLELADTCHASDPFGAATRSQALLGSPRYMAPEQIRSARDVDGRADVWSLGVILHELLCGERPFDSDKLEPLRKAILEEPPRPLLGTIGPTELRAAIATCLAKDRADRFPDVLALGRAIAPFGGKDALRSVDRTARILQRGPRVVRSDWSEESPLPGADGGQTNGGLSGAAGIGQGFPRRRRTALASVAVLSLLIAGSVVWRSSLRASGVSPEPESQTVPPPEPPGAPTGTVSAGKASTSAPMASTASPPFAATETSPPSSPGEARKAHPSSRMHPRDRLATPAPAPDPLDGGAAPTGRSPGLLEPSDPLGIDGSILFNEPH